MSAGMLISVRTNYVPEGFASRALLANVIGEPQCAGTYPSHADLNPSGDDYAGSSTQEQRYKTLEHAYALMGRGSELVIAETYTPHRDIGELVSQLDSIGFVCVDVTSADHGVEFDLTLACYGMLDHRVCDRSVDVPPYVVSALKV